MSRFYTKVDGWVVGLFAFEAAVCTFVAVSAPAARPLVALIFVGTALALFVMAAPVSYTLEDDALVVRSGLRRWRISYRSIERVEPGSRSPALQTAGWSLDRLHIRYEGGKSVMVSPRDREGFLEAINERIPHAAVIRDGELV